MELTWPVVEVPIFTMSVCISNVLAIEFAYMAAFECNSPAVPR